MKERALVNDGRYRPVWLGPIMLAYDLGYILAGKEGCLAGSALRPARHIHICISWDERGPLGRDSAVVLKIPILTQQAGEVW